MSQSSRSTLAEGHSLQAIASAYGVTRKEVWRVEQGALRKLWRRQVQGKRKAAKA